MAQKPIALIVGLGNPGDEYRNTRHNVGFDFVDRLAQAKGARFSHQAKFFGETARISTPAGDVWLLKPTTYMNLSGQAVQPLAAYYKISPEEILIVHDELDLAPGTMRLKFGGSNAGHNGLKDINDGDGYSGGDAVLAAGAVRSMSSCRIRPYTAWAVTNLSCCGREGTNGSSAGMWSGCVPCLPGRWALPLL